MALKRKKTEAWGQNGFEDWGGYMEAKKAKLEEQFQEEAKNEYQNPSTLFKGIAIFVNGYTDPSSDDLRRLMMQYGGVYHHYLRPKLTTHIIASNLPYSKIVMYRKAQCPLPICKPEWITESIKAGKVLSYDKYLLYTNCTDNQRQLNFKGARTEVENIVNEISKQEIKENEATSSKTERISSKPTSTKAFALSSKNSQFISEFYNNSRLHHIATMGTTFKDYVNELRDRSDGKFTGLELLMKGKTRERSKTPDASDLDVSQEEIFSPEEVEPVAIKQQSVIMHIDMDCFFVSVGLRNRPELRGLPVAVAHARGTKVASSTSKATNNQNKEEKEDEEEDEENEEVCGSLSEIASCSYEAREAGVRNGMHLGQALKICPELRTIKYDFEGYKEVSYTLYNTVASYTLDIEAVSCDELYADCTKILEQTGLSPLQFATILRDEIKKKTGCPVSTGFGENKLLARLATKKAKPNGQFYIERNSVESCINNFQVYDLPGVGYTTTHKLHAMKINTCAELRSVSLMILQKNFGKKMGELLYNICRGIDNTKLNLEHVRKSVSVDVNYGIRFADNGEAVEFLKKLCEEMYNRLRKINGRGRNITLKLMVRAKDAPKETAKFMGHGPCDYITKSKNLIAPVHDLSIITKEVISLWNQMHQPPDDVRGIGIQISRLEILKNKTVDMNLMNFIERSKQPNREERTKSSIEWNANSEPKNSAKNRDLKQFFLPKATAERTECNNETATVNIITENTESNSETVTVKTATENTEGKTSNDLISSVSFSEIILPSQDIDDSVLNELPDSIKKEILHAKTKKQSDKNDNIPKDTQTRQEEFFRQIKPTSGKSTKTTLPPIQEIDMSVLLELPENIRNEIFELYKIDYRQNLTNEVRSDDPVPPASNGENVPVENISFSQVDPDFLAALPEELLQDVQQYCAIKKKEQQLKTNNFNNNNRNNWNVLQRSKNTKTVSKLSKSNGKNLKKTRKKDSQAPLKRKERDNKLKVGIVKETNSKFNSNKKNNGIISANDLANNCKAIKTANVLNNEREAIVAHNLSIITNQNTTDEYEDTLVTIVKHFLNLPIEQIKTQLQAWVANSKIVNEVDFLSFATFLSMLPEKKRLEDLHILLKTMHRCSIESGSCVWHQTYENIVKHVQRYMQISYRSDLFLPSITCDCSTCV